MSIFGKGATRLNPSKSNSPEPRAFPDTLHYFRAQYIYSIM